MTSTVPAERSRRFTRTFLLLGIGAAAFWFAGVAAGFLHATTVGVFLRLAGLALAIVVCVKRSSLLSWTFFAMFAGVELGLDAPHAAVQMRFLGDLFLRLIRMIVSPLLFATITTRIAGHGNLRSIGRVAVKALVHFE